MVSRLFATASRLWRTAPFWKYTVMAAGLLSMVAVLNAMTGGSGAPSYPDASSGRPATSASALVPSDPASDARLANYEASLAVAAKLSEAGTRCEQTVTAYALLTTDDQLRGRNVRASSKSRLAAMAEGERCRESIRTSDARFGSFERAITAAETNATPKTFEAAATASAGLDGFDRSRPRFARDAGLIAKGKGYADSLAASDARIRIFSDAAAAFGDGSVAAHIQITDAAKQLTDFDRGRLTPAQQVSLEIANQAAKNLRESRARLAKLGPLLAALPNGQTAQLVQQLVDATAAITPFDEALATPAQKDEVTKARTEAGPLAWSLLQTRVNALVQGETPEADQAVVAIWKLLRDFPGGTLSDPQRALLDKGRAASETLAASDDRLGALLVAAETWRRRNGSIDRGVLAEQQAITPFDQKRFQEPHKAAWAALSRAAAIIRGPELGLTAVTKSYVAIFVFTSQGGDLNRKVADSLRENLRRAGFQIVTGRTDAALLIDVIIERVDEPTMQMGQFIAWRTTARLSVNAVWAVDDSSLFTGTVEAAGQGADRNEAKPQALRSAVAATVDRLSAGAPK
jgi:hypothetical protein